MFRILPFLIILLFISFSSRIMDFISEGEVHLLIKEVSAEEKADDTKEEKDAEGGKENEGAEEDAENESEKEEENEAEVDEKEAENMDADTDSKDEDSKQMDEDEKMQDPRLMFSNTEIEILQSLAKRREMLDQKEEELSLRENMLLIIKSNIEDKIKELKGLQSETMTALEMYNKKENKKILSLVKVYQNMKPQDAANIFMDLDIEVLLPVASNMKEASLALILSKMDARKARDLTIEIANRRRIKRDLIGGGIR